MHLVLASASPRRAELLTAAGFSFDVMPADVDETPHAGEAPAAYALRVARSKAAATHAKCRGGAIVLGADTVVVGAGRILGKPADRTDAERMLKILSGAVHDVLTAVVLQKDQHEVSDVVDTRVRFVSLSKAEIAWYIDSKEPTGKAGAYAIQGRAARFIDWIEGSWSNVVGLPVATVHRLIKELEGTVS